MTLFEINMKSNQDFFRLDTKNSSIYHGDSNGDEVLIQDGLKFIIKQIRKIKYQELQLKQITLQ